MPTWADNQEVQPIEKTENPFLQRLGLADRKIVLYSGNFGKTHDLESMVRAAKLLEHRTDIHFLLIGGGEQFAPMQCLAKSLGLENLTLLPYQDRAVFPQSVASGDVTLVSLEEAANSLSTPSKTYFAMAAGSAVVAVTSKESELAKTVERHRIGRQVDPHQPERLARVLVELLDDEEELAELKRRSREASFEYTPKNAERIREIVMGARDEGEGE